MTVKNLAIQVISLKQWLRNVFHFANVDSPLWADSVEKLSNVTGP